MKRTHFLSLMQELLTIFKLAFRPSERPDLRELHTKVTDQYFLRNPESKVDRELVKKLMPFVGQFCVTSNTYLAQAQIDADAWEVYASHFPETATVTPLPITDGPSSPTWEATEDGPDRPAVKIKG